MKEQSNLTILKYLFSILCSQFSVLCYLLSVLYFLFPISNSLFPTPYSPSLTATLYSASTLCLLLCLFIWHCLPTLLMPFAQVFKLSNLGQFGVKLPLIKTKAANQFDVLCRAYLSINCRPLTFLTLNRLGPSSRNISWPINKQLAISGQRRLKPIRHRGSPSRQTKTKRDNCARERGRGRQLNVFAWRGSKSQIIAY